ncbi:MAG TPA: hypothetical protein DEA22_10390, partial [Blastocatellia bacterium]|nr:hypothetical protein [Blastocatellia bacterium]
MPHKRENRKTSNAVGTAKTPTVGKRKSRVCPKTRHKNYEIETETRRTKNYDNASQALPKCLPLCSITVCFRSFNTKFHSPRVSKKAQKLFADPENGARTSLSAPPPCGEERIVGVIYCCIGRDLPASG